MKIKCIESERRRQRLDACPFSRAAALPARNPKKAKRKHEKGIAYMCACEYALAEQELQEALIADSSFGPAHNSLGKLYFDQRKFYLSAWEFEHAIKSMPERAEPLNNLGLVYEEVGKLELARVQYESALSIDPENAEYLGNLLRVRIRGGEEPAMMRDELQSLIALDHREEWVRWAKLQLVTDRTEQGWRQAPLPHEIFEGEYSTGVPVEEQFLIEENLGEVIDYPALELDSSRIVPHIPTN